MENIKVVLKRGHVYVNTTPHEVRLRFEDGEEFVVEPSGILINAKTVEVLTGEKDGIQTYKVEFVSSEDGTELINKVLEKYPNAVIIGSIIAAQAYKGRVYAMKAYPGFERVAPSEKVMCADKFTVY